MDIALIIGAFFAATLVCILVKHRGVTEYVSFFASIVACGTSIVIAMTVATAGAYTPFQFFSIDALGAIALLIISTVGCAVVFYSIHYLREETAKQVVGVTRVRQYFILLNLFLAAMSIAVTTASPMLAWISIEATTLSTAFLISFYNKQSAMEAAWKYLIINSVGLLLAFFGTLLYFSFQQSLGEASFVSWDALRGAALHLDPSIAKIAFVFVLIGYGTKVGLFPMHTWLPDAHSNAPAPISALLSGVLLNVALVSVLRFKLITDVAVGHVFSDRLLMFFGLLSICIAVLIIFTQKNYKRLLAYSSIENMGIMALGFGFGGIGAFAAMLHMLYHALVKSALFLSSGTIFLKYHSTKIADVKGAIAALPVTSIIFLTGFFAITGMPPLGIFFTKILVLSSGITTHPIVTIIALLCMAVLFVGFFKQVTAMMFGEKSAEIKNGEINALLIISPLVLILLVVYLSFSMPSFLLTLMHTVANQY
ncbi:MAG: proton-conducting transporter membrane subunit [bacterium]|nr:proton-conducting transporter membrane subunit [bacterium]